LNACGQAPAEFGHEGGREFFLLMFGISAPTIAGMAPIPTDDQKRRGILPGS